MIQPTILSYSEIRKRQRTHMLRQMEVPTEHTVSLPLPTRRWGAPAYACFASPALRRPGTPAVQGAPDRWWVVDARNGHLVVFALWTAVPFAPGAQWDSATLPPPTGGIGEVKSLVETIELLMEALAPAFFTDQPGDAEAMQALAQALRAHVPEPLWPQYQALVPDFFAWLGVWGEAKGGSDGDAD